MTPRPLALALSLFAAASLGDATAAESGLMDAWKAYAQSSVTPAFGWAEPRPMIAPTLRPRATNADAWNNHGFTLSLPRGMQLAVQAGEPSTTAVAQTASMAATHGRLTGLSQVNHASTLSARLPSDIGLSVGAVISQQRFLTPGMGESFWQTEGRLMGAALGPAGEMVSGFGLRAEMELPAGVNSRWHLSLQSRIDMDTFKSYRGVYSEAGDFDTPAQAGLRFAQDLGPTTLSIGVERIYYSGISAVTSYGLPNRLLSLLGDGNSPEFAWRDHTVYSLGMDYALSRNGVLGFHYSTRLQPSPTSPQLRMAMQSDFSDRNFALSYRHTLGRLGALLFSASHSGASYFVGAAPLRQSGFDKGSINEFEVLWALPF